MQTVRSRDKNSRYAHSNGAFSRDERILFNDIKTYLKCKLQGQLQMAVYVSFFLELAHFYQINNTFLQGEMLYQRVLCSSSFKHLYE